MLLVILLRCRWWLRERVVIWQIGKGIIQLHRAEPSLGNEAGWLSFEAPNGEFSGQKQMARKGFIIGAKVGQAATVEVEWMNGKDGA